MRPLLVLLLLLASLTSVAHADRPTARALMEDGDLHLTASDKDGALDRYRKAIDADPDLLDAYDKAIPLWLDGRRFAEAATYLERATARHPSFTHAWYALGFIYRQQHRYPAAIAAYEESTALQPGDAAPWYGLAASHDAANHPAAAVHAYRVYRSLERDPARASYRRDSLAAIDRLLGAPATLSDAALRLVLDGGTLATIKLAAKLP